MAGEARPLASARAAPARLVGGLCLLAGVWPLLFSRRLYDMANLPQVAAIDVSALLLLTLLGSGGAARLELPRTPFDRPALALLAWAGLSLFWAHNPYEGLPLWIHWIACAAVYVVALASMQERATLHAPLLALFASGAATALLGLVQYTTGFAWIPQAGPPAATFANRNVAAGYVVLTLPLAIGAFASAATAARRWLVAAASALMVLFVLATLTRSAWAALSVEAALLALLARGLVTASAWRRGARRAALVLLAVLGLAIVGLGREMGAAYGRVAEVWRSFQPAQGREGAEPPVTSVRHRVVIWRNTLVMVRCSPLSGVGLGNHRVQYPAFSRAALVDPSFGESLQLDYVHNDYLQVAAELGLLGLGLLGWLGLAVFRALRAAHATAVDQELRWIVAGIAGSLTGLAVDALFSFPFERAVPPLALAIELGALGAILARLPARSPSAAARIVPRRGLLLAAGAALVIVAALQLRALLSDALVLTMTRAGRRRDWAGVTAAGAAAYRYDPHRHETLFLTGTADLLAGRAQQAAVRLGELVSAYPYDMNGLGNLGLALAAMGQVDRALDCYRRVLAIVPDDAKAYFNVGDLLQKKGRLPEALDAFRLAARFKPDVALYHFRAGVSAMLARSNQEALKSLSQAVALDPRFAQAQKALGVLLFEVLGQKEEGKLHLQKALELAPQDSDAPRIRELLAGRR